MAKGIKTGGGSRKGKPNKKTQELIAKVEQSGITPLEVMLEAMRELYSKGDKIAASLIAKDAAPYIHAKLSQVEQKSEVSVRKIVDANPLTPDEWERLHGVATAAH